MLFTLHTESSCLTAGLHSAELCIDFSDYPNGNTVHINRLRKHWLQSLQTTALKSVGKCELSCGGYMTVRVKLNEEVNFMWKKPTFSKNRI